MQCMDRRRLDHRQARHAGMDADEVTGAVRAVPRRPAPAIGECTLARHVVVPVDEGEQIRFHARGVCIPPQRWESGMIDGVSGDDLEHVCPRCASAVRQRYYGPCSDCRTELAARFAGRARTVAVADYEPKMNVTPNAVAMRDE